MRILIVPNGDLSNGISFYRFSAAFPMIKNIEYEYYKGEGLDFYNVTRYDLLYMQNPFSRENLNIIQVFRRYNRKIWVDMCDNLLEIPIGHRGYDVYNDTSVKFVIKECLSFASVITTSTESLADYLKTYFRGKAIMCIPDAYPLHFLHEEPKQGKHNFATWRGSDVHAKSIDYFKYALIALSNNFPDVVFNFVGYRPSPLYGFDDEQLINLNHYKSCHVMDYMAKLQKLSSKIHYVCLYPNFYNMAKSNIAWIEATLAGSVCVMPKFPNFENLSDVTLQYNTIEEFAEAMKKLIDNYEDYTNLWKWSIEMVYEQYDLRKVNKQREKILWDI